MFKELALRLILSISRDVSVFVCPASEKALPDGLKTSGQRAYC